MELYHVIILGIVQGATEFLPISSSGHLVLFQALFGMKEPEIFFDIALHLGTLVAVCVFYCKDLKEMIVALFSQATWCAGEGGIVAHFRKTPPLKLLWLIVVGTIPTALFGLAFKPIAEKLFSSIRLVGLMLLITGILLWLTRRVQAQGRKVGELTVWDGLCVGIIQGLAILPGISRSGTTIALGLFRKIDRETTARYSFLLSIPAILGAAVLELAGMQGHISSHLGLILSGACIAGLVGYIALKILIHFVKRGNLYIFAPYCWLLGLIAIVFSF